MSERFFVEKHLKKSVCLGTKPYYSSSFSPSKQTKTATEKSLKKKDPQIASLINLVSLSMHDEKISQCRFQTRQASRPSSIYQLIVSWSWSSSSSSSSSWWYQLVVSDRDLALRRGCCIQWRPSGCISAPSLRACALLCLPCLPSVQGIAVQCAVLPMLCRRIAPSVQCCKVLHVSTVQISLPPT